MMNRVYITLYLRHNNNLLPFSQGINRQLTYCILIIYAALKATKSILTISINEQLNACVIQTLSKSIFVNTFWEIFRTLFSIQICLTTFRWKPEIIETLLKVKSIITQQFPIAEKNLVTTNFIKILPKSLIYWFV